MNDWRLYNIQHFKNIKLQRISFPQYWKEAYESKNDFYRMIKKDAYAFVESHHKGSEYLEGDNIRKFWHSHCELCTKTITTDESIECYCTTDYTEWICKECFDDFKELFGW